MRRMVFDANGQLVEHTFNGVAQPLVLSGRVEAKRLIPQPGDVLGMVVFTVTGEHTANCGICGERKKQMNEWGWLGCVKPKNFKVIKGWIVEEARKRGHEITERHVAGLLRAAFKEIAR